MAVPVGAGVAYLHLPLVLVIGPSSGPDRLRFLVSMLGVETTAQGWRIAALFTTTREAGRRSQRRARVEWDHGRGGANTGAGAQ